MIPFRRSPGKNRIAASHKKTIFTHFFLPVINLEKTPPIYRRINTENIELSYTPALSAQKLRETYLVNSGVGVDNIDHVLPPTAEVTPQNSAVGASFRNMAASEDVNLEFAKRGDILWSHSGA